MKIRTQNRAGCRAICAAVVVLATASQAVLLDDFESYSAGNASNASPTWATTDGSYYADIYEAYGSKSLSLYGGGDYRDISRSLGGTFSGKMTNEFDVFINAETGLDHAFGLSDLATPGWYGDFGVIVRVTTDTNDLNGIVSLDVYLGNGSGGGTYLDDVAPLNIGEWYTVKLVADTASQSYNVFLNDAQVYTNAGFRKAITVASTFVMMASSAGNQYNVAIDNLKFAGSGVPFTIESWAPTGGGVTNQPTLEAVFVDGTDAVDTNAITMYLDGSSVSYSISQSGPTTTVSHAVSTPLDQITTHTGRVVVAGTHSGSTIDKSWTFITGATGKYVPPYTLVEDFESYPAVVRFTNGVTTAGIWHFTSGVTVPADGTDTGYANIDKASGNTFAQFGDVTNLRGFNSDVPDIAEGSSGRYFFRIRSTDSTPDAAFGLSDVSTTNAADWGDFEAYVIMNDQDGDGANNMFNLRARDGGAFTNILAGIPVGSWLNVELDIHNNTGTANDTYDVYTSFGANAPALIASGLAFRNGTTNSLTTFLTKQNTSTSFLSASFDDIYFSGGVIGPTLDPDIQSIVVSGGNVTLTWTSETVGTYSILHKASLTDPAWTAVTNGISGGAPTTTVAVPGSGAGKEFYKISGE